MFFNPQVFYDKVAKKFTFENWTKSERKDQLNEERFFDMINESDINYFGYNYKISDKISGEPDYLKPNAPKNDFFTTYLIYENQIEKKFEIYLWGLLHDIYDVSFQMNGITHRVINQNNKGAFEYSFSYEGEQINTITISSINDVTVNIELKTKKGYCTRPI
jgi:hypothetical protein